MVMHLQIPQKTSLSAWSDQPNSLPSSCTRWNGSGIGRKSESPHGCSGHFSEQCASRMERDWFELGESCKSKISRIQTYRWIWPAINNEQVKNLEKKIFSTYSPLHGREEIGNGWWSPIEKALMQHDAQTFQTGCFVSGLNAFSYQFKIKRFRERP